MLPAMSVSVLYPKHLAITPNLCGREWGGPDPKNQPPNSPEAVGCWQEQQAEVHWPGAWWRAQRRSPRMLARALRPVRP